MFMFPISTYIFLFFAIHPTPKGVGFRTVFVIGDDEYPYGMPMNHFYC